MLIKGIIWVKKTFDTELLGPYNVGSKILGTKQKLEYKIFGVNTNL